MDITISTTPDEDAAILALGVDKTPDEFILRHVRHQLDYALSLVAPKSVSEKYDAAPADVKAQVDALLSKAVTPKGTKA